MQLRDHALLQRYRGNRIHLELETKLVGCEKFCGGQTDPGRCSGDKNRRRLVSIQCDRSSSLVLA